MHLIWGYSQSLQIADAPAALSQGAHAKPCKPDGNVLGLELSDAANASSNAMAGCSLEGGKNGRL